MKRVNTLVSSVSRSIVRMQNGDDVRVDMDYKKVYFGAVGESILSIDEISP